MSASNHNASAMRIAFVVSRFPQLSESFILDQISGMLDLGDGVGIYAESRPTDEPVHPQKVNLGLARILPWLAGWSLS